MANDHFLAQTYLKHFGDATTGGMLHAYKKPDGKYFACWPKDVCREWDGDLNEAILDRPELLGDYRKMFEPHWNPAIANILTRNLSPTNKFVVAAYMANMMVCTPAWRRVGETVYGQQAVGYFRFDQAMKAKRGEQPKELAKAVELLEQGTMKITGDPSYIKGIVTRELLTYACMTYNLDWLIIENDTDQPYLTSDNPVAMSFSGRHGDPVTRLLPVTPKLCLSVVYRRRPPPGRLTPEAVRRIMNTPPLGVVTGAKAKPVAVREINRLVVQCAEELVFSSREDDGARELTKKYGRYPR